MTGPSKVRPGIPFITHGNLDILRQNPKRMDRSFLKQFQDYRKKSKGSAKTKNHCQDTKQSEKSLQEFQEEAYQGQRQECSYELLSQIKTGSPVFFELLLVELMVLMGYRVSL